MPKETHESNRRSNLKASDRAKAEQSNCKFASKVTWKKLGSHTQFGHVGKNSVSEMY